MSELTLCSYCKYEAIKRDAKKNKKKLVKYRSVKMEHLGGWEVHVIKNGETTNEQNWISWMMEIPGHCVC